MSKSSKARYPNPPRSSSADTLADDSPWQPTSTALKNILQGLASLRLTVALFAMAIFIVLAGTLGQVQRDIWDVIHDYFRMNTADDSGILTSFLAFGMEWNIPKPWTWIDLSIFFPPSFSPDQIPPDLSSMTSPARMIASLVMGFGWAGLVWLIPLRDKKLQLGIFAALGATFALFSAKFGGFWFPKGWTIGAVMAVNLLAAHLIRFKIQSKGTRLWAGLGVIGLGILAIMAVIMSGSNKDGVLQENWFFGTALDWSTIWVLFQFTLALILVLGVYAYISLWQRSLRQPDQTAAERSATVTMRRIVGFSDLLLAGVLIYLVQGGSETQLSAAGMRILWQLLKATAAALVLLAGCALVFRKRAGVVVLHSGVALVMLSELLVGVAAVETQMQIVEGQSANYVRDTREVELAVVDPSDPENDRVVVIPKRFLKEDKLIQDNKLPVNIRIDEYYRHSKLVELGPKQQNPATEGFGQSIKNVTIAIGDYYRGKVRGEDISVGAVPVQGSTGTDNASSVDHASAYVTLFEKTEDGGNGRALGTWLVSQHFFDPIGDFQEIPQTFEAGGKTYEFALRFKRTYKPYTITLQEASQKNYVGTNTPRDYRSIIDLKDPSRNEDRKGIHIWMNNPLRFGGETFYQSGLSRLSAGKNMTTLQVVTNDGWMIPYVACMIVAVGMLAHFMIALLRFLNRDSRQAATGRAMSTEDDPMHDPPRRAWLTPALSVALVLIFGGYLASKARPPKPTETGFDLYEAGKIPVAYEGRVKPLDTLARNTLRVMSNRQTFQDASGNEQPAMQWLLDVIVANESAKKHRVFRIDYQPVLDMLKLQKREGHLYSLEELSGEFEELLDQIKRAKEVREEGKPVNTYQKKVLELEKRIQAYRLVELTFGYPTIDGKDALTELVAASMANQNLEKNKGIPPLLYSHATETWEIYNTISLRQQIAELAKQHHVTTIPELSRKIVEDFAVPLAAFAVKDKRGEVTRKAKELHSTFAETAQESAANAEDENLRQVYEVLAASSPRDNEMELVERLPETVVQELAKKEAAVYLFRVTGGDQRLLMALLQRVRGSENPEMAVLEFMVANETEKALGDYKLADLKPEAPYQQIFDSYKTGDPETFNQSVAAYLDLHAEKPVLDNEKSVSREKLGFESFFNNAAPFYYLAAVYLIAGLLAAVSWLMCSQPLNRATFWLLCFALIIHTAALIGRIYISGRPPVTNLYSSAVFIGWGCVLIGLLFEWFYDIGIGNLVAAVAGFMTLSVAHLLTTEVASFRGDSFTVMQAVLDTQFWLATHVVCISMGYATTFVAGFLGIAYILGGMFTPLLTAPRRKDLLRMIYGTLCFAIFFSFVGTVLGGLWADDSWGRFWGWDTKENGALIIVLWNALVLHARWGGIVKDRGLAALVVAGNIAVSWSWFGVNELGIGLHSYGFTEGVLPKLALFCVSQMLIVGIGCLPNKYWWSHIAEQSEAAT